MRLWLPIIKFTRTTNLRQSWTDSQICCCSSRRQTRSMIYIWIKSARSKSNKSFSIFQFQHKLKQPMHTKCYSTTMPPKHLLFSSLHLNMKKSTRLRGRMFSKMNLCYLSPASRSPFRCSCALCLHEKRTCANVKFQHNNNSNLSQRRTKLNSKKIEIKTKQANNFFYLFFSFG